MRRNQSISFMLPSALKRSLSNSNVGALRRARNICRTMKIVSPFCRSSIEPTLSTLPALSWAMVSIHPTLPSVTWATCSIATLRLHKILWEAGSTDPRSLRLLSLPPALNISPNSRPTSRAMLLSFNRRPSFSNAPKMVLKTPKTGSIPEPLLAPSLASNIHSRLLSPSDTSFYQLLTIYPSSRRIKCIQFSKQS